jgi:hypothetical protein
MDHNKFKEVLSSFTDNPKDIMISGNQLVVQIRNEVISIEVKMKDMSLYVIENGEEYIAANWIVNRIAKLPLLADRLIDYIYREEHFVVPTGNFLDQIENNPEEKSVHVENVVESVKKILDDRSDFTSNVLYLTSDAGEGKTTLISKIAQEQAEAYKRKKTNWLLIPILLGGRPFLRLDDIVIASFVNQYRFQIFYWDAFIQMVKMGVIIPAFDGFEEMFIESTTDEALSSLGNLLNQFNSAGTILISARKAYFDFKSFRSQAKLFDTIHTDSVSFSKMSLNRWDEKQFHEYAKKRGVTNSNNIYNAISKRLKSDHPILTRPVLVKRLLDVTERLNYDEIGEKIGSTTNDYFSNFVDTIIEREVNNKWIDRSGELAKPLLNLDEHHKLLSMIAQEMWYTNTESLHSDVLDLISDLFSEVYNKDSRISSQIKERIKQHALLVSAGSQSKKFRFDHDEFRQFFLGKSLAEHILMNDINEVKSILKISNLPQQTAESSVNMIKQKNTDPLKTIKLLQDVCLKESSISYMRENCGMLVIRLIDKLDGKNKIQLENMAFTSDALLYKNLKNIHFIKSYFGATELNKSELYDCSFIDCNIERLNVSKETIFKNVYFEDTTIDSIIIQEMETEIFDPSAIQAILTERNCTFFKKEAREEAPKKENYETEIELVLTERILRRFIRATQINENIIKLRLGNDKKFFIDEVLPILLDKGVISVVQYLGGGRQRRFKLGVPMNKINSALTKSKGKFKLFIDYF